jgi:hypothetical protein
MLYKCNYAEQKNLNTAPVEETGQLFFFMQGNILSSFLQLTG